MEKPKPTDDGERKERALKPKALLHELAFAYRKISELDAERALMSEAVGHANETSGGDWALDDPSVKAAVEAAHITDMRAKVYESFRGGAEIVDYPDPNSAKVAAGSRVQLRMNGKATFVLDIGLNNFPGWQTSDPDEIDTASIDSPIGALVNGRSVGEVIEGRINDRPVTVEVVSVDQEAQATLYDQDAIPPEPVIGASRQRVETDWTI